MNEYITINEFCEQMKISRPTYYMWLKDGLPRHKLGGLVRLDVKEVTQWIKDNKKT